jgi:YVTN family beta-propeller protein
MKRSILIGLALFSLATATHGQNYKFLKNIPIGGEGGWDYLSIDAKARKLFVTHASKIVVVDLNTDQVVGEIADTPGVHGFAIADGGKGRPRGYSSNGAENRVSVVDLESLKTATKIETGKSPDAIVYEPGDDDVFVFNGGDNSTTVIKAKTHQVIATIPLGGKPEFAVANTDGGNIYCNLEDKNEVVVIAADELKVRERWPLAPGEEPTGIAFDPSHDRLFVGCHNKVMEMLDSNTGKVVASVPIGAGVDGCAFDEATQLAFASCGDGTITIAKEEPPDKLTVVQTLKSERGARTMALDPGTHRIYTCTAQIAPDTGPSPSPGERRRPNYVPDTFHLLVYGRE